MDNEETELNLKDFVESRYREMKTMLELSSKVSGNNAPQQQLPRHMRRRAASHNVKRLPLALRERFLQEQLKSGPCVSNKRPSRKHRRRPKNLLSEYARRSRKVRWMETHIWHARRFHMGSLWRCRVPLFRNDRGVRAAYRDSKNECLIGDLSWMHCLEVVGGEGDIVTRLGAYTHRSTGLLLEDEGYLEGQKEGRVVLYSRDGYPQKPICVVSFVWRSVTSAHGDEACRHLFLWTHPSSFHLLLDTLVRDLCLRSTDDQVTKVYAGEGVKIIDRTGDFNRFRLVGPKAQSVLFAALKTNLPDHDSMRCLYGFDDGERSVVQQQVEYWNESGLLAHHLTPPHCIVPLLVADPRLITPSKPPDPQCHLDHSSSSPLRHLPPAFSPIWDSDKMAALKAKALSTHQLNQLKAGSSHLDYNPSVPLLLLHQPPSQASGSEDGGWDVVLPSGWGMAFWLVLVHQGARSIGLRELDHLSFEAQRLSFPSLFPDTPAGKEHHLSEFKAFKSKFERMPPAKRCNYQKYNVPSPFHCPFQELCNTWVRMSNEEGTKVLEKGSFFVIRDLRFLRELKYKFEETGRRKEATLERPIKKVKCVVRVRNSSRVYACVLGDGGRKKVQRLRDFNDDLSYLTCKVDDYVPGLVCVHLVVVGKGAPRKYSIIYLPCEEDLRNVAGKRPVEEEALKQYPRVKKAQKRKDEKKKRKKEDDDDNAVYPAEVDEDQVTVSSKPGRLVIGYVLQGGFSFGLSRGTALAFITLPGALKLASVCQEFRSNNPHLASNLKNTVLVRDSRSLCCRYASCCVLTHVT